MSDQVTLQQQNCVTLLHQLLICERENSRNSTRTQEFLTVQCTFLVIRLHMLVFWALYRNTDTDCEFHRNELMEMKG